MPSGVQDGLTPSGGDSSQLDLRVWEGVIVKIQRQVQIPETFQRRKIIGT